MGRETRIITYIDVKYSQKKKIKNWSKKNLQKTEKQ